jgi:uncharacterized protein YbcV (DUF1398 family)
MNTQLMHDTLHQSEAGNLTFSQVITALAGAGVESYRADLITAQDTFYLPDGRTHAEPMTVPAVLIAEEFSAADVQAAIRAAQADTIRYPEFLKRAMAAGAAAYQVFITGRKVIYFGRKGDFHIELFPTSKA